MPPHQVYTRVTLKDVARRVGVSVNAASKVLNNTRSSGQVSEDTRRRILEVAKELGYQPNSAARSLVRRRSDIIAMYFDVEYLDTAEPFTAALIEGAERGCRERNQSLLLYTRGNDLTADDTCRKLLSGTADGVVVASWTNRDVIDRLVSAGIPVIHYPIPHPELPSILIDEKSAATQLIDHLNSKGHKRILYHHFSWIDNTRPDMYIAAAEKYGIEIVMTRSQDGFGFLPDDAKAILSKPRDERPTAIACWNDEFAYRALDYCHENGLSVPGDVAVVGFDGARTFPTPRESLTTMVIPWGDVAMKAVCFLVDIRDGKTVPKETLLPVTLQLGDTT